MSRIFNPQKEIEFKPPPLGGAISPVDYTYHIEDIVKASLTMRHGTAKPTDIVDGEFWCKNNADGSFTIFRWREADGEKDGTNIHSYTLSATANVGSAPVGILDPETGEVVFDGSWDISNPEISQAIPVDPALASTEKIASEQAVSQAIANIPEPEKADDYIEDYYPKTDAEKAAAGDSWWRKWKSGFIEQGGYATRTASTQYVNLNIPMKTTKYTPTVGVHFAATSGGYVVQVSERSTTRMQVHCDSGWYGYHWRVSGY